MPPLTIKKSDIERLLNEHKLTEEIIGDSPTGRVYMELMGRRYYYRPTKAKKGFYVREIMY